MLNYDRILVAAAAAVASLASSVMAAPPTAGQAAREHFMNRDFAAAAERYSEAVAENPYRARDWQNYGFALHTLGRYDEARAAFVKSIDMGFQPATSCYNIACGYALLGRADDAFEWLDRAIETGFQEPELLATDTDLDALRDDPRFAEITGLRSDLDELTREEGWRHDIDLFARRMEQVHYDLYGVVSRERFTGAVAALRANVPDVSDLEIIVELQRITAMVGDGHTVVMPPDKGAAAFHQYPIELYQFTDGLFVLGAVPGYESIVGGRVLAIGDTTPEEAMTLVTPLVSRDNPMGILNMGPRMLVIPEVLAGLGIIEEAGAAPFVIETVGGESVTVTLAPGPLTLGFHDRELVWANAGATAPLPRYLRKPREAFWFEYLEDEKLVYFQFNVVRDTPQESIAEFCDRLFAFIEATPAEHLVIDMRNNSGGNNFLNRPLVHGLIKCEKVNRDGHLFVITGRRTFSAAMNGATDIEQNTNAMFVGEPTGSKPNFVGETTMITLPCSGLRLSCSSLYWQRSTAMDDRIWIAPDLLAERSSEDFRTNRDPAMEAILAHIAP